MQEHKLNEGPHDLMYVQGDQCIVSQLPYICKYLLNVRQIKQ